MSQKPLTIASILLFAKKSRNAQSNGQKYEVSQLMATISFKDNQNIQATKSGVELYIFLLMFREFHVFFS